MKLMTMMDDIYEPIFGGWWCNKYCVCLYTFRLIANNCCPSRFILAMLRLWFLNACSNGIIIMDIITRASKQIYIQPIVFYLLFALLSQETISYSAWTRSKSMWECLSSTQRHKVKQIFFSTIIIKRIQENLDTLLLFQNLEDIASYPFFSLVYFVISFAPAERQLL